MAALAPDRSKEIARFALWSTLAAIAYGIPHDLVTAHVAPYYFQPPYHPTIVNTDQPIFLALIWGVLATWWFGFLGGLVMGLANGLVSAPSIPWSKLRRVLKLGLVAIWSSAMLILAICYGTLAYATKTLQIVGVEEDTRNFLPVCVTHLWSYIAPAVLVAGMTVWIVRERRIAT